MKKFVTHLQACYYFGNSWSYIKKHYYVSRFSRADVQKFFKRLRISLKRAGYLFDSSQLRYILTSDSGYFIR